MSNAPTTVVPYVPNTSPSSQEYAPKVDVSLFGANAVKDVDGTTVRRCPACSTDICPAITVTLGADPGVSDRGHDVHRGGSPSWPCSATSAQR